MDIGKSFSFVFEDKKWIEKILIGGILMLVPILGSILMLGYGMYANTILSHCQHGMTGERKSAKD